MSNYIVGIDIGASKVCGVVGTKGSKEKLQILGVTTSKCNGIRKLSIGDIKDTSKAVKETITQLEDIIGDVIKEAYLSIPLTLCEIVKRKKGITLSSQDREIKSEDIETLIDLIRIETKGSTDKSIISINPLEFKINDVGNINDPLGLLGKELEVEVQVVLISKDILQYYEKAMKDANIKVLGYEIDFLGVYKDVICDNEIDDSIALIDIGAETTDIAIIKNNRVLHSSMIGLGGDIVTNDISICLKISKEDAANLKIKSGRIFKEDIQQGDKIKLCSVENNEIMEIDYNMLVEVISERIKELINLCKEDLIKSGYFYDINSIILLGGGISFYRKIVDLVTEIMEKPTKIGTPSYVGAANPIYTIAVGIIREQVLKLDVNKNIENIEELKSPNNKLLKNEEEKETIVSKVKAFLSDFF